MSDADLRVETGACVATPTLERSATPWPVPEDE